MKVTKYFIPLIETTGEVHISEWINIKGETFCNPLLTYDALVCFPNSHASYSNLRLSTLHISSGNIVLIISKDICPNRQCKSITLSSSYLQQLTKQDISLHLSSFYQD